MARELSDLPDLPPELEGAAADLGRFRAEYRSGAGLLLYTLLGLVLFVFGLALLLLLLFLCVTENIGAHVMHGFIAAAGLIVGGAVMAYRSMRAWGARVLVFERCLVYLKRGRMRVFGWDEIAAFEQKSPTGAWEKMVHSSYLITLRRHDGDVLTIDAYVNDARLLGAGIQAELARRKA